MRITLTDLENQALELASFFVLFAVVDALEFGFGRQENVFIGGIDRVIFVITQPSDLNNK